MCLLSIGYLDEYSSFAQEVIDALLPGTSSITDETSLRFLTIGYMIAFSNHHESIAKEIIQYFIELLTNKRKRAAKFGPLTQVMAIRAIIFILASMEPKFTYDLLSSIQELIDQKIYSSKSDVVCIVLDLISIVYSNLHKYELDEIEQSDDVKPACIGTSKRFSNSMSPILETIGEDLPKKEQKAISEKVSEVNDAFSDAEPFKEIVFASQAISFNKPQDIVLISAIRRVAKYGFLHLMEEHEGLQELFGFALESAAVVRHQKKQTKSAVKAERVTSQREREMKLAKARKQKETRMEEF